MKIRSVLLILIFVLAASNSFAQIWGDGEAAEQYVRWAGQAIEEGRWGEALAALERAADFANVSSDVSYLLAYVRSREGKSRVSVIEALDKAIETNRWVSYNAVQAFLLKAEQLIAVRRFTDALYVLDQAEGNAVTERADLAILRLLAFRGLASGNNADSVQALARFRGLTLSAMDRFPRDPRPLRIFFEYARDRNPEPLAEPVLWQGSARVSAGDMDLLELALRRLPFLVESDPELAWMAALFTRDTEEARRLVASYRAGGISHIMNRDFRPVPSSIAPALNLGLLGDIEAVEELFSGVRGFNSPFPSGLAANGFPVLDLRDITDVYSLLRSEEGRFFFTRNLLSFSGIIISDDDRDGYIDSHAYFQDGVIVEYARDINQENIFDLQILFSPDGVPVLAGIPITGQPSAAVIVWEQYPSVEQITLAQEMFLFRPADFQFAPVTFVSLGGSGNFAGLAYPVPQPEYMGLTRRTLVSFSSSIRRPSLEFDGAVEEIFLERGIPLQIVETLNGREVSVTEFSLGLPVTQRLDLDLDGRMETIRRFRRPPLDFDFFRIFNYSSLIASSQSDWTGEGVFKTGEVYLEDGSVVYTWDMDGSGIMNYSETEDTLKQ